MIFAGATKHLELLPDSNVVFLGTAVLIYGYSLITIKPNFAKGFFLKNKAFLFFPLLAFFSFFWSVSPSVTLIRGFALLGTLAFGVFIVSRYSLKETLELIFVVSVITMVLNFFFVFFIPSLGVHQDPNHFGLWKGAFGHKNILARTCTFFIISNLYYFILISRKLRFIISVGPLLFFFF